MSTTRSLDGEVRRRTLLELLDRDGSIHLASAAENLGVSEMTIRRDLADLEENGLARRVRGGATRALGPRRFSVRSDQQRAAKESIARKALALVPTEGAIALDASTTAGTLAAAITAHPGLLVATNSWENFLTIRRAGSARATLTGGEADDLTDSLVGPIACRSASSLGYRALFASASGIETELGTTDVSPSEAQVKSEFARTAERVVILADSSKIGQRDVARSFVWSDVDLLITELDPSDGRLDGLREVVELT